MINARTAVARHAFARLDAENIPYCLMNGTGEVPSVNASDLDVLVPNPTFAEKAVLCLQNLDPGIVRLVKRSNGFCVLQCSATSTPPQFLLLDFTSEVSCLSPAQLPVEKIIQGRRITDGMWVVSPGVALANSLAKAVIRGSLTEKRFQHLLKLHDKDALECRNMLEKIWPAGLGANAIATLEARNSQALAGLLPQLRKAIRLSEQKSSSRILSLLGRMLKPSGRHIVMLGPDGAGKSSVVDMLESHMTGPFAHVMSLGFAPPLYKLWRKGKTDTSKPHAAKPRSFGVSCIRALFWLFHNLVSHVTLRIAKSRDTLIVNDRHFIDILVDPVRYRYGGPRWILQMIKFVMPRPDAIILLNGPPHLLQARKKELSLEETARQCRDYLLLVEREPNGRIVDASQPFEDVMRDVLDIVFSCGQEES